MVEIDGVTIHALTLHDDEYEKLLEARKRMYGDNAEDVELGHVISLLALEEINRQDDLDAEEKAMFDGMDETDLPHDYNEETSR